MQPQTNTENLQNKEPDENGGENIRILDIIREIKAPKESVEQMTVVRKPAQITKKPTVAENNIPTLESMGGVVPENKENLPPVKVASTAKPESTSSSNNEGKVMEVYKPPTETQKDSSDTNTASPVFTKGLSMKDIVLESDAQKSEKSYDTSLGGTIKKILPQNNPAPKSSEESIIPSIHTLRDDMQSAAKNQSMSLAKISALEEKKRIAHQEKMREENTGAASPRPNRKSSLSWIIPVSIALIVIGGSFIGGYLWYRAQIEAPIELPKEVPKIIFAEQAMELNVSNTSISVLKEYLNKDALSASVGRGSVLRILPTVTPDSSLGSQTGVRAATASEFFAALNINIPSNLLSSIKPDFFFGAHGQDGAQLILVLPISSYEKAFAAMLDWEETMGTSLSSLFPGVPNNLTKEDGTISVNTFTDVVIKNFDVRVIYDAQKNPRILYSFPNRETLVITSSPYTLLEIFARIQAAQNVQ